MHHIQINILHKLQIDINTAAYNRNGSDLLTPLEREYYKIAQIVHNNKDCTQFCQGASRCMLDAEATAARRCKIDGSSQYLTELATKLRARVR